MKLLKTIFITLSLLIIGGFGVMAQNEDTIVVSTPQSYIDKDGNTQPITSSMNMQPITNTGEDSTNKPFSMEATSTGSWFWAGQAIPAAAVETVNEQKANTYSKAVVEYGVSITGSGEINIVVGPNGTEGTPAMEICGGLKIPQNVTVNIYQAADGLSVNGTTTTPTIQNCFLSVQGTGDQVASVTVESTIPGITVESGGTLNVYSGAICGTGSDYKTPADGIQVNGTVQVTSLGQLQGNAIAGSVNGISITSPGTLNANGGTIFSYSLMPAGANGVLGAPITGSITPNGSTIFTSSALPSQTLNTGQGYLWMQIGSTGLINATAAGTSTFSLNGYVDAVAKTPGGGVTYPSTNTPNTITFGSGESLTVQSGANLTIPANINVTMDANSTLTNNGTINILSASTQPST